MSTMFIGTVFAQTTGSTRRRLSFFTRCCIEFREWRKCERLRTDLCGMDDRELQDFGITRGEIDYITSSPAIDPRGVQSTLR